MTSTACPLNRRRGDPVTAITRHLDAMEPVQKRKLLLALNIDPDTIVFRTEQDFKRGSDNLAAQRFNHYLQRKKIAWQRLENYYSG